MSDLKHTAMCHSIVDGGSGINRSYNCNCCLDERKTIEQLEATIKEWESGALVRGWREIRADAQPPEEKGIKQTLATGKYVSGNGKTGD